jgi:outer membrane protein
MRPCRRPWPLVGLYYEAHSARAAEQARERALQLAHQVLATAIKREQRGVGSLPETLQARSFVAKAELELARAVGQHKRSLVALAVGLGLLDQAGDVPVLTLSSEVEEDPLGLEQNLPGWLQSARQYHPRSWRPAPSWKRRARRSRWRVRRDCRRWT